MRGGDGIECLGSDLCFAYVFASHLLKALWSVVATVFYVWRGCSVKGGECAFRVCVEDDTDEVAYEAAKCFFKRRVIADLEEIGVGYTRMRGDGHDARVCISEASVKLEGEEKIGELGLLVRAHGGIILCGLQVAEVNLTTFVSDGCDGDDAGPVRGFGSGFFERGHEKSGEGEVPEDVGAKLKFEAVGCLETFGRRHDAGVVDEHMKRPAVSELFSGKVANGGEGSEVKDGELCVRAGGVGVEAVERVLATLRISAGEHDVSSFAGELECSVKADAAVGSCDQDTLACEG